MKEAGGRTGATPMTAATQLTSTAVSVGCRFRMSKKRNVICSSLDFLMESNRHVG